MIRVAVCGKDEQRRLMLRAMVDRLADHCGVACLDTKQFDAFESLERRIHEMREGFLSIAICHFSQGVQDAEALMRLVKAAPGTYFVIVSPVSGDAVLAYECGARFLLDSADAIDFVRVMKRLFDQIAFERAQRILVKSKKGVDSLPFEKILFAETSSGSVLVHLPDEEAVPVRSSLQALFEGLAADGRFVKAGSSFIVNLDNVRSIGSGSVIFADGEAIIVPIRARQPLKEAYEAYCFTEAGRSRREAS